MEKIMLALFQSNLQSCAWTRIFPSVQNPKQRNDEVEKQLSISVYLTSLVDPLGPLELFHQDGTQMVSFDFIVKRAPDIFQVIAEKFPKTLGNQMESWDKTKNQFSNSVNSGTYERPGRYKNFFEALFYEILIFRRACSSQIHMTTLLNK